VTKFQDLKLKKAAESAEVDNSTASELEIAEERETTDGEDDNVEISSVLKELIAKFSEFSEHIITSYNKHYTTNKIEHYLNTIGSSKWSAKEEREVSMLHSQGVPSTPFSKPLILREFFPLQTISGLHSMEDWTIFHAKLKTEHTDNWWFLLGGRLLQYNRTTSYLNDAGSLEEIEQCFEQFVEKYEFDHEFIMNHFNMCMLYRTFTDEEKKCVQTRFFVTLTPIVKLHFFSVYELFVKTVIDAVMLKSRGLSLSIFLHKANSSKSKVEEEEELRLFATVRLRFFFFGEFFARQLGFPKYSMTAKSKFALYPLLYRLMHPLDAKRLILFDMMMSGTTATNNNDNNTDNGNEEKELNGEDTMRKKTTLLDVYRDEDEIMRTIQRPDYGAALIAFVQQQQQSQSQTVNYATVAHALRALLQGNNNNSLQQETLLAHVVIVWFVIEPYHDTATFCQNLMLLDLLEQQVAEDEDNNNNKEQHVEQIEQLLRWKDQQMTALLNKNNSKQEQPQAEQEDDEEEDEVMIAWLKMKLQVTDLEEVKEREGGEVQ